MLFLTPRNIGSIPLAIASSGLPQLRGAAAHAGDEASDTSCRVRLRIEGKFFARGGQTQRLRGVTYGPFKPNHEGAPFPSPEIAEQDLAQMSELGINALRVYHEPPRWFLEKVAKYPDLGIAIDIPWSKHLCFLESEQAKRQAREAVRAAATAGGRSPAVLAYSVGNEIPADIVRWHGARRVERFIGELVDVAKQADPQGLVTYANFPPTEYLELPFLDFATFNVYLHNIDTFHRYLLRLQNLVGEMPLVLGEIGMDTIRHGEIEQAAFLSGHVRQATLRGLAGTFVFSWTDEWFTGGQDIQDWAFGITHADRAPKASFFALREVFEFPPSKLLLETPRVSVVVCSYNGGRTLRQCLNSLTELEYPNYEVILVDDGSKDNTREIAAAFPSVRTIHQDNQGLSVARNVGLHFATGSIIAYTDSDCFADPDWLTHLVAQLQTCDAAGVGGPNLAPEDGRVAACVAASPGQPMHVLESDQVAEHIPGCNMAFRREALEAINGFDAQFLRAGDDVDLCWRLQQAGYWITFAPGAFVWHHRRQSPQTYFKQQTGYGEAEALLRFKHPDKFNAHGSGKWRGVLYGASLQGLVLDEAIIYRGVFGTGMFQCIYQPGTAHWAMTPSTLEWHAIGLAFLLMGLAWWPLFAVGAVMLALAMFVAVLQSTQAKLTKRHEAFRSRALIMGLCWAQPLVRSWARYKTRYFGQRGIQDATIATSNARAGILLRKGALVFWGSGSPERTKLLHDVIAGLKKCHCGQTIDTGWTDSDLQVFVDPWTVVHIKTAQEEHGGGKRVIRANCTLRLSRITKVTAVLWAIAVGLAFSMSPVVGGGVVIAAVIATTRVALRGAKLSAKVMDAFDHSANAMGLVHCPAHDDLRKRSIVLAETNGVA